MLVPLIRVYQLFLSISRSRLDKTSTPYPAMSGCIDGVTGEGPPPLKGAGSRFQSTAPTDSTSGKQAGIRTTPGPSLPIAATKRTFQVINSSRRFVTTVTMFCTCGAAISVRVNAKDMLIIVGLLIFSLLSKRDSIQSNPTAIRSRLVSKLSLLTTDATMSVTSRATPTFRPAMIPHTWVPCPSVSNPCTGRIALVIGSSGDT